MISYQTDGTKMPDIKKRETSAWIKKVADTYGKKCGEIAYIFCDDEKILEGMLNNLEFAHKSYFLSFI